MRNNIFLGLLLGVLNLFGTTGNNRHNYQASIEQRAILDLLLERHYQLPHGSTKRGENEAALKVMTKGIPGISLEHQVEHLRKNGLRPYRVAVLNLIKSTMTK